MIYFVAADAVDAVKVGTTSSPDRLVERMKDLQVGRPVVLRLVKTIAGGRAEEKTLHGRWDAHRLHGEWFTLSAIADEIAELEAVEVAVAWSCPTCGKAKSNRPKRGRTCLCRACARACAQADREPACVTCVECGARLGRKNSQGNKRTFMCRPCAMRLAWKDPVYRERRALALREAHRRRQVGQGPPGPTDGGVFEAVRGRENGPEVQRN